MASQTQIQPQTESQTPFGGDGDGHFAVLRSLLPYLWPAGQWEMRARVVLALALLGASKVATIFVPILFGQAVDLLSGVEEVSAVVYLPLGVIVAYGLARILALAFAQLRDGVFARVGQRVIRTVALQVFRHLHALSLRFHLTRQTGGLSRSIERGTKAIEMLLRFSLFNVIPTAIEIILVFGILWGLLDFWIALVTMITVFAYVAFTASVTERRLIYRRRQNESDNQATSKAIDSLLNFETVKYFGNEEHEASRYDQALEAYEDASVKNQTSLAWLNTGQAVIIAVGLTAVMYMAAVGIVAGEMSIGDFVMVNTYLMQLYQPLNFFGFVYREMKQGLIDIEKMFDLLRIDAEITDEPGAPALVLNGGAVEFDGVSFAYDPRRSILHDVSFTVPAGKSVAFVGASGAGKSTIGRLLYRFYDVNAGTIRVDGQDVRAVTQESLRAAIGVVPQDTVLFNDTVYYNVSYAKPGAPPSEVEEAARLAHIHDFVMSLPDGYQTVVGERGLKLSGGEKQRVAIARTILKSPGILLFDEATSALDSHTEQEIQANLRELSAGRTTLMIAHRLSTVVDADEILVLEEGGIIERGRHAQLLAADGAYAAMWRRQQESEPDIGVDGAVQPGLA